MAHATTTNASTQVQVGDRRRSLSSHRFERVPESAREGVQEDRHPALNGLTGGQTDDIDPGPVPDDERNLLHSHRAIIVDRLHP